MNLDLMTEIVKPGDWFVQGFTYDTHDQGTLSWNNVYHIPFDEKVTFDCRKSLTLEAAVYVGAALDDWMNDGYTNNKWSGGYIEVVPIRLYNHVTGEIIPIEALRG